MFFCLTDIARYKNPDEPKAVVANWMRLRSTIEFLDLWEQIHNPDFKGLEFDAFKKLDVSKLKNIQRLDINSESVKNINFKGNKKLKTLIVRGTKSLKSMNIEALPALNKVELEI